MKFRITAWFLAICVGAIHAQKNGETLSRQNIHYPVYDSVQGIGMYYDKATYNAAIEDKSYKTEKIVYRSDGLKVVAYLSTPALTTAGKLPVIIFNRGSYIRNDIAYVHAPLFQKFVKAGFIVISPALRESEGGEGKDELGGKDADDIMNLVPLLAALPFVDTSKMFMLGESRGGMMTYIALREKFPVKAAVTIGAITDMETFLKDNPGAEQLLTQINPDYKTSKSQQLAERSAVDWADKINIPVLVMNGQADPQVKPYHALMLANKLQEFGKTYQLIILEGGNHILSGKYTEERDRQVLAWFEKYMNK